ncbi:unnamed protein product [Durusdinium trenchii]|uniref:Uncharacterized protein n=1 Tax=Durusdinium trenchii TaxID=1381693 RepID=A0ABP0NS27_9DINO
MEGVVRHVMSCCCLTSTQAAQAHQLTYDSHPKVQELSSDLWLVPVPAPPTSREATSRSVISSSGAEMLSSRSQATMSSRPVMPRRPLSAEEQQSERERMHDMVREFAKLAVKGLNCQMLTMGGPPRSCSYCFDKVLRRFTISVEGEPYLDLQLEQVVDVKKDVMNTPFAELLSLPPPHSVSGELLKKRVVCLSYKSKLQEEVVALLMPNQYDQERFYSCMKILRWALEMEMKPRKSEAQC